MVGYQFAMSLSKQGLPKKSEKIASLSEKEKMSAITSNGSNNITNIYPFTLSLLAVCIFNQAQNAILVRPASNTEAFQDDPLIITIYELVNRKEKKVTSTGKRLSKINDTQYQSLSISN